MNNMYQVITTHFLAPTNHRPGRVKATAAVGSVVLEWDNALSIDANHMAAAKALAEKMEWRASWYGGGMPGHNGYAFVQSYSGKPDFVTHLPIDLTPA